MVVLKAKQSLLTMQYNAITTFPLYLYKAGYGPADFLNCDKKRNAGWKILLALSDNAILFTLTPGIHLLVFMWPNIRSDTTNTHNNGLMDLF